MTSSGRKEDGTFDWRKQQQLIWNFIRQTVCFFSFLASEQSRVAVDMKTMNEEDISCCCCCSASSKSIKWRCCHCLVSHWSCCCCCCAQGTVKQRKKKKRTNMFYHRTRINSQPTAPLRQQRQRYIDFIIAHCCYCYCFFFSKHSNLKGFPCCSSSILFFYLTSDLVTCFCINSRFPSDYCSVVVVVVVAPTLMGKIDQSI